MKTLLGSTKLHLSESFYALHAIRALVTLKTRVEQNVLQLTSLNVFKFLSCLQNLCNLSMLSPQVFFCIFMSFVSLLGSWKILKMRNFIRFSIYEYQKFRHVEEIFFLSPFSQHSGCPKNNFFNYK